MTIKRKDAGISLNKLFRYFRNVSFLLLKCWYFVQRLHALQQQLAASVLAQQNERRQEGGEELCQTPVRKKQQTGMRTKRVKRLKDTESHQRKLKKIPWDIETVKINIYFCKINKTLRANTGLLNEKIKSKWYLKKTVSKLLQIWGICRIVVI